VANFPALDLSELLDYRQAVRSGTLEYLRGVSAADFESVPRERRPEITIGVVFRQIIGELYQHLGQVAYLKGLQRGASAFPPNFTAP
jgi:hypothetical protein